jgi:ADP-dependent NAD(P)H-hydrate dehydratase
MSASGVAGPRQHTAAAKVTHLLRQAGGLYRGHTIKGDSGAVIVVGGSARYPGPPLLSVRAAIRTGVDDARAVVPAGVWADPIRADVHINHTGAAELDPVSTAAAVADIAGELLPRCRAGNPAKVVLLIGPGLGGHPNPDELLTELTDCRHRLGARIVTVADGHLGGGPIGRQRIKNLAPDLVLLSHREAAELTPNIDDASLREAAASLNTVMVVKAATDRIVSSETVTVREASDGAVQLTRSGTGDVLAGTVSALLAHGLAIGTAAEIGCWLIHAASRAAYTQHGPGFLPSELADQLSTVLLSAEGTP